MGKKKTTTSNEPPSWAKPYIQSNLAAQQQVFDANQPKLDKFSGMAFDTYGKLNPGAVSGIMGAQGLVNDTIGGKYLAGGNPYIEEMVRKTRGNVLADTQGAFSAAGRYGSDSFAKAATDAMSDAELGLRYENYGRERQMQQNAIGQAQDLMRGNQSTLEQAAALPWTGVQAQSGVVRQNSNGYGTTTTTTRDPWGTVMGLAGAGATAYASDPRIKENIVPLGQGPAGLGMYEYDNKLTGQREQGFMADEVAAKAPGALGPNVGGVQTVNYGALGMDGPQPVGPAFNSMGIGGKAIPDAELKPKSGFDRWLEGAISPDASTTRGKIGLLGQALMAGSGSAFAPLGQSLMAVRQQQQNEADRQHEMAVQERQMGIMAQRADRRSAQNVPGVGLVEYDPETGQSRVLQPEQTRAPTTGPLAYLAAMGIDPRSAEGRRLLAGSMTNSPEAIDAQQELAGYRAGLRPARGGGGRAAPKPPAGFILD